MKKLSLKGASWDSMFLSFAKVLTILFSLVSAKILSTGLTLTEYGTYSQANLVNSIGTSLILLGLVDALSYYFNRKNEKKDEELRQRIVNTVFFCEISVGLILAILIILGSDFIALYFDNPEVKHLLPIVSVLPTFANLIYFYKVLLVGTERAKIMSGLSLVLILIRIAAVYMAVYTVKNLLLIYAGILAMDIIQITVYEILMRKQKFGINPFRISVAHIKPIFAYGLPMGIYAITSAFTRELDKLVVGRMGGTEELAIYANCSKQLPVDIIVTSFSMVLIPYIYGRVTEGKREESIDLFSSYMKVGYYSVWTLATMLLITPATVISFLYSDLYVAGCPVFVLYVFDNMIRFASVHLILTAAGKTKQIMVYSIISLVLNLILNVLFYHLWGIIGPAISTLVVAFIYMFLILSDTKKTIGAKWSEVFDFKDLTVFTLSLVVMWYIAFVLNRFLVGIGLHAYISMIISMAVFGLAILGIHFKRIFAVLKKINSFKLQ